MSIVVRRNVSIQAQWGRCRDKALLSFYSLRCYVTSNGTDGGTQKLIHAVHILLISQVQTNMPNTSTAKNFFTCTVTIIYVVHIELKVASDHFLHTQKVKNFLHVCSQSP